MKKVLLATIAVLCFNITLSAQNIEQDITYYKLLNKLWAMSGSFDKVAFHLDNQSVELEQTRQVELEAIEKLYAEAKSDLDALKDKKYSTEEYSRIGEMLVAMERSLADLKSEKWTSDPMWQYGYNVVKLRLGDLELNKETTAQYSRNK